MDKRILSLILVAIIFNAHQQPLAQSKRVQFVDVAAQAGLTLVNTCGSKEKWYIIEAKGGGAAAFLDYDNDGDLDVYLINGSTLEGFKPGQEPTNKLYRNNGDGTFTDVTERAGVGDTGWGMGCSVADYDNDGYPDIYVTNYGPNVLYHNNGDGTFTDVTNRAGVGDKRWSTGSAWGDYDKDGDLDLYVSNYLDFETLYKRKDKSLQPIIWRGIKVMAGPRGLKGAADVLYRNNGDGTFTDVTRQAGVVDYQKGYGFSVVFGDYDNDGDLDLYIANDSTPNYLYQNNGDGTFTEVALIAGVAYNEDGREQAGMGVAYGDYDNDGYMDIFVTNFSDDTNTLYHNEGNGFFTDVTFQAHLGEESLPYVCWGSSFFDYDNDGDLDLFVPTGHVYPQVDRFNIGQTYAEKNLLFENNGDGTFTEVSEFAGPGLKIQKVSRGACYGDYDNDGDVDILILNLNDAPTLLRNEGGNRNNWLMIKTIGTRGNRDGVGAKIKVVAGELVQYREVTACGSSFLSQNDMRVHFGLGKRGRVDLIEIKWLSGEIQRFKNIPANQLLVVKEGEGIVKRVRF